MDEAIEMSDFSKAPAEGDAPATTVRPAADSSVATWAWLAAVILFFSAACLSIYPRILLFMSEDGGFGDRRVALTPLESFLALHSGIWLGATVIALLLNLPDTPDIHDASSRTPSPSGHPLLGPITVAGTTTAFLAYNTTNVGTLASVVSFGSGVIGLFGLWVIMFHGSSARSKTTGVDKRTSAFLFSNKSAASVQKKQRKKEQKKS